MKTNLIPVIQFGKRPIGQNICRTNYNHQQANLRLFSCKTILILILVICFSFTVNAQVSKTINITAGTLSTILTATELSTITNLTLTGTIDARDFKTMRDKLPLLKELNIGNATIMAYNGSEGTSENSIIYYPANTIPESAFRNLMGIGKTSLNSVILPTTLTSFGILAFNGCTSLNSITIPPSVVTVGREAFAGCTGLISLDIPPSIKSIGESSFFNTGLTTLTIPSTVNSIGNAAFYGCRQLTTLSILTTTTLIDGYAFGYCDRLISITVSWTNPPYFEGGPFVGTDLKACTLHVPWGSALKYKLAYWHGFINIVEPTNVLSASSAKVASTAGSAASINVITEGAWTASSDQSWLVVSPSSGTGKQKLTFTAATNTSVGSRIATITFKAGNETLPVTITQAGSEVMLTINNPGSLITSLTSEEQKIITNLIIKGNIDARDFKTIRDKMPLLTSLDLSDVNIVAYDGTEGTLNNTFTNYPANTIPENAFYNYFTPSGTIDNLVTIVLPQSITGIGNSAFWYGLTALKVLSPNPIHISPYNVAFSQITENCTLYVPYKSASRYTSAEKWKEFRSITEASSGFILSTYNDTIEGAEGTTHTVTINANVAWSISSDQDWLTISPTSGNGNQTITIKAKANELLTKRKATITISGIGVSSHTTTITQNIQPQPEKILEVTAGGLASALNSEELNSISILTLKGTIDARDFKTMRDNMPLLAKLDLSAVNIIAYSGTEGTSLYNNAIYPDNTIPETAFCSRNPWTGYYFGKTSLKSIILPSTLVSLGHYSFWYCSGITDMVIPLSVTTISEYVFYHCEGMASVSIPKSVKSIETSAFRSCTSLSSVIIPSSVTYLGSSIFADCEKLTSITVNWTVPPTLSSYENVFYNLNKSNITLNVPYGTSSLYAQANQWKDFKNIKEMRGFLTESNDIKLEHIQGSTASVNINSDVVWTAQSNQTWLTVSPNSGSGLGQKLTFTAEANPSYSPRIATVTLSSEGIESQIITITQAPAVAIVEVTAGGLASALTTDELSAITNLTITGSIDARDFKTMRDKMPLLSKLDLSEATIAAYNGSEGTMNNYSMNYPANEIPTYAFTKNSPGNSILQSIVLPQSLTSIGSGAFYYCIGLTDIDIPSKVTTIKQQAFYNCSGLKSVILPSAITSIESNCFAYCFQLSSITVGSSIPPDLKDSYSVFYYVDKNLCVLNVPYGSEYNYRNAYQWRDFLKVVEPSNGFSVASKDVKVAGSTGSQATIYINSNIEWTLSSDKDWLTIDPSSGSGKQSIIFTADANPSFIATRSALVTVSTSLPGVPSQQITVTQSAQPQPPKTLELIPGGLATALTTDELATLIDLTLTGSIDARDFKTMRDQMPLLTKLDISKATIVEYNGSEGTGIIGTTNYPANTIPEQAFYISYSSGQKKNYLTSVVLPESLTAIGQSAFAVCQYLNNVTIPVSVTNIGSYAFLGCESISEIIIPSAVTTIGSRALGVLNSQIIVDPSNPNYMAINNVLFNKSQTELIQSSALNSGVYEIPSTVTSIGDYAFSNCNYLTSVTIPSSVTSIGKYAFYFCRELVSMTLSSSVTSIGESAFAWCSRLNSFYAHPITPVDLNASIRVFYQLYTYSCILYVPIGSKAAYQTANQWRDFRNIIEVNPDLIANAGPDKEMEEGTSCLLYGSFLVNTGGKPLTYQWTAPEGITLISETDQYPIFTAPEVTDYTTYTFSLIVSDGLNTSTADQVFITVRNVNKAPIANAGADQIVNENSQVTLDGSASNDPDGNYLNYEWTGPNAIYISSRYSSKATFTAPNVSTDTNYTFYLMVNDGNYSRTDTVIITVKQVNKAPIARAGKFQYIDEGSVVTLDGDDSIDPDGEAFTFLWTAPTGITLSSTSAGKPTFKAPEVETDTYFTFTLVVNDGKVNSEVSEVSILIRNIPALLNLSSIVNNIAGPVYLNYKLFMNQGNSFIQKIDTFSITGETLHLSLEPGDWIVLASPARDPSAFIPTYIGNVINWNEAEIINMPDKSITSRVITCIRPEITTIGIGQISGFVYEKPSGGTTGFTMSKENVSYSTPIPKALIHLYKKGSTIPVASVYTDFRGAYSFYKLEMADYQIVVEIPGYIQSDKFTISLSTIEPKAKVYFAVDTSSKVITDNQSFQLSSLKVYPNPFVSLVTIDAGITVNEPYQIQVYTIQGGLVSNHWVRGAKNNLDLSKLSPGTYFIKICIGSEKQTAVVVKI